MTFRSDRRGTRTARRLRTLRRFTARHRAGLLLGAAIALVLIGGVLLAFALNDFQRPGCLASQSGDGLAIGQTDPDQCR